LDNFFSNEFKVTLPQNSKFQQQMAHVNTDQQLEIEALQAIFGVSNFNYTEL